MKPLQSYILFAAAIALCLTSCRHQAAPVPAEPSTLSESSEPSVPSKNSEPSTLSNSSNPSNPSNPASLEADFVLLADVCPDIIQEIRYYTTYNFVGERIPGVCDDLKEQGYRLKVFDAYRPQMAVDFFVRWGSDLEDQRMKEYFYPDCPKSELFRRGYIAHKSGHTRGSTLDLTLFDMKTEREVDMGGTSRPDQPSSHPARSHDAPRFQAHRRRMVALHPPKRTLSRPLLHLPDKIAFCRASECYIQLRKHYVAHHDAISIRESTLSRVTMLYLIGESILSRFVMLYQIVQAL